MFKNYLTVAMRNLSRHKAYSVINIFGLAIGIASCILILLFVQDELSFDQFHHNPDRIHRVLWDAKFGDNAWKMPLGPVPVADVLTNYPEIAHVTRFRRETRTFRHQTNFRDEKNILFTDPAFFDIFTVTFVSGSPQTALNAPDAIVLTQETAQQYFPNQTPLGKTLELESGDLLRVTGVVKAFPPQSHFHFDFLADLSTVRRFQQQKTGWGSATVFTYLRLKEHASATSVEAKLQDYIDTQGFVKGYAESGGYTRFPLQGLTTIHLTKHRTQQIYIFSFIAGFILLLACINFVNLATARATNRAREVGVRKVLGSNRAQLARQFFFESCLYVTFATILALGLSELGLPILNVLSAKQISTASLISLPVLSSVIVIIAVVALLAGAYPAIFLARFRPITALKTQGGSPKGGVGLRNGLVVIQFAISIVLLVGTLVVQNQIGFMQNKLLGFDKENVLVLHNIRALGSQPKVQTFVEQLGTLPAVKSASVTQSLPGRSFDSTPFKPEQPAAYEQTSLPYVMVDEHYVNALGLKIVDGRNFSPSKFPTDKTAYLINETAAKTLGWNNPIGKTMTLHRQEGTVIGVVQDFHYGSVRKEIRPLILPYIRWGPTYLAIRLNKGNYTEVVSGIKNIWTQMAPNRPFAFTFLDEDYNNLYKREQQMVNIFGLFAALAIFIAALGLFGLASFTAELRTKEIGIRKVLGATVSGIVLMLSKDFICLVLIAFTIATPLAYLLMDFWLQDFAYRINISWWTFALAGGLALLTALLTISWQATKAARTNPIEALRYE